MAVGLRRRDRNLNIWPGFVDALATLIMVVVFVLMIFNVFQFYLKDIIYGRDQALSWLNEQLGELADVIQVERRTTADLRGQLSLLSAELGLTVSERDKLRADLGLSEAERQRLGRDLAELGSQRDRLSADLKLSETERLRLGDILSAAGAERERLAALLQTTTGDRDRLQAGLTATTAERDRLQTGLTATTTERDRLRTGLATVTGERDRLQAGLTATVGERDRLQAGLGATVAERDRLLAALAATVAERDRLQAGLTAANTERDRLQQGLTQTIAERDRTQAALVAANAARDRTQTALAATTAERDRVQAALAATTTERDRAQTALATTTAERDRVQAALAATTTERDRTQTVLAATTAERDRAQAALAATATERDRTQAALSAAEAERNRTQAALTASEADRRRAANERDQAAQRAAATAQQIELVSRELENAFKTIDADREKIEVQLRDLAALQREIQTLIILRREVEAKLAEQAQQLAGERGALTEERKLSESARQRVDLLTRQLETVREQLARLNAALEASETKTKDQQVQIAELGGRLNMALASRVEELARYRSEFFGRLREVLGQRGDIRVVGDRFVFQSEILFPVGSSELEPAGREQLAQLAETFIDITSRIPPDLPWVLQVEGHTDRRPIRQAFTSNWELSASRAIAVVKFLASRGIPETRLAAAGFGEFQPLDAGGSEEAFRRNRRIELKLTSR